jgi:hypothetical protein
VKKYKNLSRRSGVLAYEIGPQSIKVMFEGGLVYTYSYKKAGKEKVEQLKKLADTGRGLSTYISQHVKDLYDEI